MQILSTKAAVWSFRQNIKTQGSTICLVPTMGFFHAGHLALMKKAKDIADVVIVTLFVNPTQFSQGEDLSVYPRDFEVDCQKAESLGVDALFCPDLHEMYPQESQTELTVKSLSTQLCGGSRPTHFKGVATVVTKLFNICQPDHAIFGEKDFQQLAVLKQMVKDLNFPIEIHSLPIVRETDGLAMSSRNAYLSHDERRQAVCLSEGIKRGRLLAGQGADCTTILQTISALILKNTDAVIDYITIVNRFDLNQTQHVDTDSILVMAVKIGKTRLLDNGILLIGDKDVSLNA